MSWHVDQLNRIAKESALDCRDREIVRNVSANLGELISAQLHRAHLKAELERAEKRVSRALEALR